MNVLITSISGKVPLIQLVKDAMNRLHKEGKLFGGDVNKQCIGRYFVDYFWHMPLLQELSINEIVEYCHSHNIFAIIPTRNDELLYFARNEHFFENNGIKIMVSNLSSLEKTLNKLIFFKEGKKLGFPMIYTSESIDAVCADSFVVKECFGSGSKNIAVNVSKEEAVCRSKLLNSPIYQPFIDGEEYSIDVYVDKNGKSKGVIVRKRVLVVGGESQITQTVRNLELEELGKKVAESFELYGHVMFQVIVDKKGIPNIVECNPRFGGASTLSVAAGLDSFYWFLLESLGENLDAYPFNRSVRELTLIRYAKDMII